MPPVRTSTAAPLQVTGSTGPRAYAPSFGANASGLAQGFAQLSSGLEAAAGAKQRREAEAAGFARQAAVEAKAEFEKEREKEEQFNYNMAVIEASQRVGIFMAENPNADVPTFSEEFESIVKPFRDTLGEKAQDFDVSMGRIFAQKVPMVAASARAKKIGDTVTMAEKTLAGVAVNKDIDALREAYYALRPVYAERLKNFGEEVERSNMERYEYDAILTAVSDFPEEAQQMLKDSNYLTAEKVEQLELAIERSIDKNNQIDAAALQENIKFDLAKAWDGDQEGKMSVTLDMVGGDKDKFKAIQQERKRFSEAGHMLKMAKASPSLLKEILDKAADTTDKQNAVSKIAARGVDDSRKGAAALLDLFNKEPLRYFIETADELRAETIELDRLANEYEGATDDRKGVINAQMHSTYQDLNARLIHMQRVHGVADDDVRLLLDDEAKRSVANLNSLNPRDGLEELMSIEFRHGDKYWPTVFNQLVDSGMSPSMFMAYNYKDAVGIRETVMEAISNEKGFEKKDRNDVRDKINNDPEVAAFAHVMSGGSAQMKSGIMGFVESVALQIMSNRPSIDVGESVELAKQYLIEEHVVIGEPEGNDQEPILIFRDQRGGVGQRTEDDIEDIIDFLDVATESLDHSLVDPTAIAPGLPQDRLREDTLAGSIEIRGTSQAEAIEAFLSGENNYRWESDGNGVFLRIEEMKGGDSFHLRDKNGEKFYIDFDSPFGGGKTNWPTKEKVGPREKRSAYDWMESRPIRLGY